MGDGPIQPVIQPITIDTMLNNNRLNIGDGLNLLRMNKALTLQTAGELQFFKHFKNSEVHMNDD